MNMPMLLRILIIAGMFAMNNCQCPSTCFCLSGYVTCPNMTSLPVSFPEDTISITFSDLNVKEIPAGIFEQLFALETIEVYSGTVDTINAGAFSNLMFLDLIRLNDMRIGTINSGAFRNITDVGNIAIEMSTIDKIENNAFSDMFALDEIKISTSNISEIESRAFSSIDELFEFTFHSNNVGIMAPFAFTSITNVHELSMYLNTFDQLGCGNIETLLNETYEHSFYSNGVTCSCDLLWIENSPVLKTHYFSNWCKTSDSNETIFWANISAETLECELNEIPECSMASVVDQLPDLVYHTSISEENSGFEPFESTVIDSLDSSYYGDEIDFDMNYDHSTKNDKPLSENALPTVRSFDRQTFDIASTRPHGNVIPTLNMETDSLFEEFSTITHSVEVTEASTKSLTSHQYETTESSVGSTELLETEVLNSNMSLAPLPAASSTSTTEPLSSTPHIATKASSETTSLTTSSSVSTSLSPSTTTNFSETTTYVVSSEPKTVAERQLPTKDNSNVLLEDNTSTPSDTDVVIGDGISKRKSNNAEASSYNENVHSVVYIADYDNSSDIFKLNIFLLISAFITVCIL